MSPTKHAWNMKNLEGTMAVEGLTVSEEIKEKLSDLAEGKTTSKIIVEELISKYKRAGA